MYDLHPTSPSDTGIGIVTIIADWTNRGEGVDIPESWTITMGSYTGTETGTTHTPDYQFEAGSYELIAYNTPSGIGLSGTTATVDAAADGYISGTPGWLFTSVQSVNIGAGTNHTLTAIMQQQVRQLTLIIEPAGDEASLIESIEGSLSGVAGTLDFATDTHGTPSTVALSFAQITEGNDAGKWTTTVRLLGIAGDAQTLTATIAYTGGNPQDTTIESDLTTTLADFNADKTTPLTLVGTLTDETSFTIGITDWTIDEDYNGDDNGAASME